MGADDPRSHQPGLPWFYGTDGFWGEIRAKGTLKDICWLRGTNGIKKGQDGSRVSLEDGKRCRDKNHSGQLVRVSKGCGRKAMILVEEVFPGGEQSGLWANGAGLPPGHSEVGDAVRSGGLRGQDGRVGHEACSLMSLHVQLTLKRWRGNEPRSELISEDVGEKLSVAHSEKKMPQVWKQGFLWGLLLFSSIRTG